MHNHFTKGKGNLDLKDKRLKRENSGTIGSCSGVWPCDFFCYTAVLSEICFRKKCNSKKTGMKQMVQKSYCLDLQCFDVLISCKTKEFIS